MCGAISLAIFYKLIFFPLFLLLAMQGPEVLKQAGGLHKFMAWPRSVLTVRCVHKFLFFLDFSPQLSLVHAHAGHALLGLIFKHQDSGGFQMVSLLTLSEVTEEGVKFRSPHDGQETLLTPEYSIQLQNVIGADIMMQLDDVVSSKLTGEGCGRL